MRELKIRKYTLVLHRYRGYDYYSILFKRVRCNKILLGNYLKNDEVHFVIDGWPRIEMEGIGYFGRDNKVK